MSGSPYPRIYAPPPPPPSPPSGGGGNKASAFSPAVVSIIAVLGSAFLVVSYYRIFAKLCSRWQNRRNLFDLEVQLNEGELDANASPLASQGLDEALIKKIPIFVYKSGDAFTVDTDCPVCLMEFTDRQELRMLPKCAHAFHVHCIDTWLGTHSTCPLCRAGIWPEEVMNQYAQSPQVNMIDPASQQHLHPHPHFNPPDFASRAGVGTDGARLNGGGAGLHGRSAAPTLRGLLNFEDQQHHTIWIPGSSEAIDPGEESLRLYDPRDHGGDSSARHHSEMLLAVTPTPSVNENADDSSRSGTFFSADTGPQVSLSRAASFKEPHGSSRGSSREGGEHKWHIPPRRPSFRRNPFSIVRSYSMGTSRRLVHALEFLDLEDLRGSGNGQSKAHEYGITTTPDYPTGNSNLTTVSRSDQVVVSAREEGHQHHLGGGSSAEEMPVPPPPPSTLNSPYSSSEGGGELTGRALKSSGRGRSVSFRSPFMLKRSLSGSRGVFSFRYSGRGRIFSNADSPTPPRS